MISFCQYYSRIVSNSQVGLVFFFKELLDVEMEAQSLGNLIIYLLFDWLNVLGKNSSFFLVVSKNSSEHVFFQFLAAMLP